MTYDEVQQAMKNKQIDTLPADPAPPSDNPIDKIAKPSFDEFLNMLTHLRTIRFGRLSLVKLDEAKESISANFKPTRLLRVRVCIVGKSATTPVAMQFNNDVGTNYLYNVSSNNALATTISLDNANTADDIWSVIEIENVIELDKMLTYKTMRYTGSVAGSSTKIEGIGAWGNKTTQITSIQITPGAGGGVTFAKGSFIEVIGID